MKDYNEFRDYFWAYISTNIVSMADRNYENSDFCDGVCFDCFRIYERAGIDIDTVCKLAENILLNVSRYKPLLNMES